MKRILPEYEFTPEQLNNVRALARECELCEDTVRILYGRGLCDAGSIKKFMKPSKENFISPFKMSGMREACELIERARDEGWAVVVYGDYDADGICASTIMANSLRDFGIDPYICVPERQNGYGLSETLIDEIFDEYFPQLFITVDCGISCAEEVEYIKEMGAEVIVTDHHELPENIPDCICINPKFNDGYIYDNLCGAGVAFKVGCALNGESAYKYLDFAAIATVADSVPLTGENRDIVAEGLKLINRNPRNCYAQFLNKQDTVTSQTLAFSIAPKINAAGRMGDAKAALTLFNESDESKIFDLSAKLSAYNLERQKCCDELYNSAKEMIRLKGETGKIIMLCNEEWNSGFVGIVAARIADEYSCPAILFVKNGDMLKGSARSVENVNIFEALKACSDYITEFGGHSQAAGVNVSVDNFDNLYVALENYMSVNYTKEDFIPTVYVNGTLEKEYSLKFVKELEKLEPYGVGNRRPMFVAEEKAIAVRQIKPQSQHISLKSSKMEFMYFGGAKYRKVLECSVLKKFIFEYNVSNFREKKYVKGFVRDFIYDAGTFTDSENLAQNCISALSLPDMKIEAETVTKSEIEEIMRCGGHGTLFIAWDFAALKEFKNAKFLDTELFLPSSKNFTNEILIAPCSEADLNGYKRVIFLDGNKKFINLPGLENKPVSIYENAVVPGYLKKLPLDREYLLSVFSLLSANEGQFEGNCAEECTAGFEHEVDKATLLFAVKIFEEMGLISFRSGRFAIVRGVKSKLENSRLYNAVKELQAG